MQSEERAHFMKQMKTSIQHSMASRGQNGKQRCFKYNSRYNAENIGLSKMTKTTKDIGDGGNFFVSHKSK